MAETIDASERLRPMRVGVTLAVLSIVFGFGLGGVFGLFEHPIKDHLKAEAEAVRDSVYHNDDAAMKKVTDKAWAYFKRAHLHGGGIGAAALALILLMSFFDRSSRLVRTLGSAALGAGALGYSLFWMLAALRAPGLGSTGLAKESLQWLALPSAGLALLGLLTSLVLLVHGSFIVKRSSR